MNKYSTFALGLVLGIAVTYFYKTSKESPRSVANNEEVSTVSPRHELVNNIESSAISPKPESVKDTEPQFEQKTLNSEIRTKFVRRAEDTPQAETASAKVERNPSKIEVTLSETDVVILEGQWSDLPRQAEVTREARGWRIKKVQSNTVLFNAGLREGNLITNEFLQQLAQEEGDAKLAKRVAYILNYITVR